MGHHVSDERLSFLAEKLKDKILVIVGNAPDSLVPKSHKLHLARRLKSKILLVHNVAHMLFAQDPTFYSKVVLGHILI